MRKNGQKKTKLSEKLENENKKNKKTKKKKKPFKAYTFHCHILRSTDVSKR